MPVISEYTNLCWLLGLFMLEERARTGRESYMRQNKWPICLSYWASCRSRDVHRFCHDYRKSSSLYWLLRSSILTICRETKLEPFMKEEALIEDVCLSRWASWGSSDAWSPSFPLRSDQHSSDGWPILFTSSTNSSTETRFNTRRFRPKQGAGHRDSTSRRCPAPLYSSNSRCFLMTILRTDLWLIPKRSATWRSDAPRTGYLGYPF
jgi:hypothetical protein